MSVKEKRSLLSTLAKEPRKKITKRKNKNFKCGRKNLYEVYTMANKITERDIYNAMINGTIDTETLKAFAEKKIAQLDKRNEGAKRRAAAKRAAGDALLEVVYSFVGDEAQTRAQITEAMVAAGHEVTVGKVGARLNSLVADGRIVKEKGKIADEDGKTKAVTFYSLAA